MIYDQLLTKDTLQTLGQLGCKCNFGHKIEYLPSLFQQIVYEMDIYFRLSA